MRGDKKKSVVLLRYNGTRGFITLPMKSASYRERRNGEYEFFLLHSITDADGNKVNVGVPEWMDSNEIALHVLPFLAELMADSKIRRGNTKPRSEIVEKIISELKPQIFAEIDKRSGEL